MKVNIIGAGVAGLSSAVVLAEKGYDVTVYEKQLFRLSAATRSAGILVTLLNEPLLNYALESRDFYQRLDSSLIRRVETLWITDNKKCMDKIINTHIRYGLNSYVLDEPPAWINPREGEHYAIVEQYIVDAGRVLPVLYEKAVRLGIEIVEEEVSGYPGNYRSNNRRITGLVVLATGPWTPTLAPSIKDKVITYKCQAASIEGAKPKIPIEDDILDYYIVPVSPTRSNIGNGPNPSINDPMDGFSLDMEKIYDVLERYAMRNPEAWESRVIQAWSAPCIVGANGLPLVEIVGEGTIVFTGFDGAGLTLAPGMSGLLADLVEGKTLPDIPSPRGRPGIGRVREPYDTC